MGVSTKHLIIVICVLLLTSFPMMSSNELALMEKSTHSEPASYSQLTRDVEFTFGKTIEFENTVTHPDFAERSAATVANSIEDFLPEGIQRVDAVDVWQVEISINILQIHVIDDRDILDAGEVYLDIWLNRDSDYRYIFDNGGAFYVCNSGDYLDVDLQINSLQYSMDGKFSIDFYGREYDIGNTQFMGGELIYVDLSSENPWSYTEWMPLNYWAPDGGYNPNIELYLSIAYTNVQKLSYPDDFPTSNDGSWLISYVYFPKLYYSLFADSPPLQKVYEQVYYGYDYLTGKNAYVIFYMFYWNYEKEDTLNLGHYYDYEPLLMFVEEIGQDPYRLVYRNKGAITAELPFKLIIQDDSVIPHSDSFIAGVSTPLMPLLGDQSTTNYEYTDIYFNTATFHYETDHGLTPFMTVPHITINNVFHQMEVGIGSIDAAINPQNYLSPLTNDVIREGYGRLDEAFNSDINVYEFQNFWGADYAIPYNTSLTLDMLHNPFEFPYIVDCWEDIVYYTEAAQDYRANGLYYDINLGLSLSVPATVTFDIPTQVTTGETYNVGIDLALDATDITISFVYDIYLSYVLNWWFIGFDESVTYEGQWDFHVDLETISDVLSFLGFSGEDLEGDYVGGWVSVSDFSTSTDLLGTMLDCTVEVHLLTILSDLLTGTGVDKLIELLQFFLSDVNLIINPTLSGYVTADLLTENSAISLDTSALTFSEGSTHKTVQMTVLGGASQSGIRLSNMHYNIEFSTDWSVGLDFSDLMNFFVYDVIFPIGTFPSITVSSQDHEVAAQTTTGYDQQVSMSIFTPSTDTTTGTTPTGGQGPPLDLGSMTLIIGVAAGAVIVGVVVLILLRKRS